MTILQHAGPESPVIEQQPKSRVQTRPPWAVIVWDDPVNLMGYVTHVFQRVFGYSRAKAEALMMQVHQEGKSIVWSGEKERAELYAQQLQARQLRATLEALD